MQTPRQLKIFTQDGYIQAPLYTKWRGDHGPSMFLLGLALLGTTLWIYLDDTMLAPVGAADMEGYNHVIYFLMVVAAIMTVMGFIGCCGALQESQCMLATFFALVLVLFIGKVRTRGAQL
ncbi:hypothetical protein HAZT_HAZT001250 [Hyalella azteca]|uniref:Tetraspanin n=1 Tax=Hyalella azteca TaxID=294128 RepID=A0A6A0GV75_HYAAZ|nr:hypothetical protein HAZT_HAZT001250 [Hyalella azteca]